MINRIWYGVVKPGCEDDYLDHLQKHTVPGMKQLAGFCGVQIMRKEIADGSEFCVMTQWESTDHIHAFAGKDITTAVVPDEAASLMIRFDSDVHHFEIEYDSRAS